MAAAGDSATRFRRIVLGWDYLRLLRNSTKDLSIKDLKALGLRPVKTEGSYADVAEYVGVYEPLLFEEVKAQIVRNEDEEVRMCQKAAVVSCEEVGEFCDVMVVVEETFPSVSENDLLLLSREKFSEDTAPSAYAFGMVEFRRDQCIKVRTFLGGEIMDIQKDVVQSCQRLSRMLPVLKTKENIFFIQKICSLSTIIREHAALHSLDALPFKNLILSASDKVSNTNAEDRAWTVSEALMEFLESAHNENQLSAIRAGLSRKPFVLIQGPPGTGKTQTILGILSAVLHAVPERVRSYNGMLSQRRHEFTDEERYAHFLKASPWLFGVNPRDLVKPKGGIVGSYPTSEVERRSEVVVSKRKYRVHVLVCAPSNSALDEIVLRVLRTGIHDENNSVYHPKIVRIGLKPHHSVQAVSLDHLVEQKLASMDRSSGDNKGTSGQMDRDAIRAAILDEAAIVFSTLSFSGSSLFSRMSRGFDVVIIDEAAQAVEPAILLPLAHKCKQVFLVGDPVQLPATVISSTADRFGYRVSLFERFQKSGYPVQMLKTQYRMHPEIRDFPSKQFYKNELEDDVSVKTQTRRPWHNYRCFGPFCFFDIDGVETRPSGSSSLVNEDEVEFVLIMFYTLVARYPELKSSSQIAVISPYSQQVKLFKDQFVKSFGPQSKLVVDVNTIDGFQGQEKDVAIFSCVRSNADKKTGFVSDYRRMNVGITRARSSILVVGSASTLMKDEPWLNLINSAKEKNCYFKVSKPYSSFFSEVNLKSLESEKPKPKHTEEVDYTTMITEAAHEEDQNGGMEDVDMEDGGADGGGDSD